MDDPLLGGVDAPEKKDSLLEGVNDPLLAGINTPAKPSLEDNQIYGKGTPFYDIAKTIGEDVLNSPIGPAVKTILGFTRQGVDKAKHDQEMGQIKFQQTTWTPSFEYYANAAARLTMGAIAGNANEAVKLASSPGSYLLDKVGMPTQLPNVNAPYIGNVKYSPAFNALAKLSGGDLNKVNDHMALAIGLDQFSFMGMNGIVNHLDTLAEAGKALELSDAMKAIQKTDLPTQFMMDRDLATLYKEPVKLPEVNMLAKEEIKPLVGDVVSPVNPMKSNPLEETGLTPHELMEKTDPSLFVYDGILYKAERAGSKVSYTPVKPATELDMDNQTYKEAMLMVTDGMGKDIKGLGDFFPNPGESDISPEKFTKYGPAALVMSPQTYAPQVFNVVGELERSRAKLIEQVFVEDMPYWKMAGTESANKVAQYTDLPWQINRAAVSGNKELVAELSKRWEELAPKMTPEELKWVENRRSSFYKAADMLGLPRNEDYLTHIFEDMADRKYVPEPELNIDPSIGERYLKERKGALGYEMDAAKADRLYADWFAKKLLNEPYKEEMMRIAQKMKKIDPGITMNGRQRLSSGTIAEAYIHNYFGDTDRAVSLFGDIKAATNALAAYPTAAWLSFNPRPAILNAVQAILGGSAQIGYGPMFRGMKYIQMAMSGATEEGLAWRKILNDGAVLMQKSAQQLMPIKTFWEKIPGVGRIFELSKAPLQIAENLGKGSIYLGAYDDAFTKILATQSKVKDYSRWLIQHGIDPRKDAAEGAFLYARKAAYDVHMDWTKAGQITLQQIPLLNVGVRFAQAPLKITEFTLKNVFGAANQVLLKAIPAVVRGDLETARMALSMPQVKTTLRLAINYGLFDIALRRAGADPGRFLFETMMLPKHLGAIPKAIWTGMTKMIDQAERGDPKFWIDTAKYIGMLSGFPLLNVGTKLMNVMSIYHDPDNINRTDGQAFVRDPRNPNKGYWTDWGHIWTDMLTPASDMNKNEYYDKLKESRLANAQAQSIRQSINIATFNGENERRRELVKQQIQQKIRTRELAREIRQKYSRQSR